MIDGLTQATYSVTEGQIQQLVLEAGQLPTELKDFRLLRESVLDNSAMAELGFPGNTADSLRKIGRITGYSREFSTPMEEPPLTVGADVVVATVAHLFDSADDVSRWMREVFVKQFQDNVGRPMDSGTLLAVEEVPVAGFHDEAVALRALQEGNDGLLSSTVVDFRVGRLLGVAFVVTLGDFVRKSEAEALALELERHMVRLVLD